jgi:hypothetical protein
VAAGIFVGFGTGYVVGNAQDREDTQDTPAPVVQGSQDGEPAKGKDGCTGDPTVDAIRRSTGDC